jgi:hypothetical protein
MIVAVFPPLAHLFWCSDLLTRRFLSMRDSPTADVPTVVCCTYWWVVTITILALIITVILSSIVLTYLSGSSPPWSLEDPQQAIIIKISSPNHNLIHSRLRLSQHRTLSSAEDTTLRTISTPRIRPTTLFTPSGTKQPVGGRTCPNVAFTSSSRYGITPALFAQARDLRSYCAIAATGRPPGSRERQGRTAREGAPAGPTTNKRCSQPTATPTFLAKSHSDGSSTRPQYPSARELPARASQRELHLGILQLLPRRLLL